MNRLRYKILAQLKTDEDVNQFNNVVDQFDASARDDFMLYWMALVYFYPLSNKMQRVFDKMETDSQRVGILSRHLIKRAKEAELPQHMIDQYVKAKKQSKRWKDFYKDQIESKKEDLSNLEISLDSSDWLQKGFKTCEDIGYYKEKKRQQRQRLHKRTFTLIVKLIKRRIET